MTQRIMHHFHHFKKMGEVPSCRGCEFHLSLMSVQSFLGGGRSSKDESVQAPEELERIHSIGEKAYPAEGPSFTQMSISVVIPTVNALITHKALQCNNCNERIARLVAKQTFCYPDWCEQCDESLWSTREMHSWQIRACCLNQSWCQRIKIALKGQELIINSLCL